MPLKGVAVTNLERICEKASRKTAVVISGAGLSSSKFLAHVVPNPHMIEASIWMHAILSQPDGMFLLFQGLLSIWGFGFLPCQHTINYASTPPSAHQPIAAHGYASTPPSAHQPIAAHGYTSTPPSAHQPNTTVVALVVRPKVHATIELTASQCH